MTRLASVAPPVDTLVRELAELIAIRSVSADPDHADDVRAAGEWVSERIRAMGGEAQVLDWNGHPLAVGEIRASREPTSAPTVLCYGHFDVQPPDPLELWESEPFVLEQRDGWLYGRGIADDKGQLYMLVRAAALLAAEGELPVNVRFACDGEEETGGTSIVEWVQADGRGADAAIVFDGGMTLPGVLEFNIALRGMAYLHVTVRTGTRDLHSGIYGGAALNALHALNLALRGVLADPATGRVPEPLRAGIIAPTAEELESWSTLPPGADMLSSQGARPADANAAAEFYARTWAEPTVEVNGIEGGSPRLQKTVLPVEAQANISLRLAPGQSPRQIVPVFERLLREAAPAGSDVEVELWSSGEPAFVSPHERAVELAQAAIEELLGAPPIFVRSGGTIPVVSALATRGIPTIVTGFSLPDSNIHSPNERLLADYLPLGVDAAAALFRRLAHLG
jgi:acetylornithine deacetylase/succinyl-diaminopimelate desuccinylase-like protein